MFHQTKKNSGSQFNHSVDYDINMSLEQYKDPTQSLYKQQQLFNSLQLIEGKEEMSQDNLVMGQDLDTLTINYDMNQRYDTQENLKKRRRKGANGQYEMSQK